MLVAAVGGLFLLGVVYALLMSPYVQTSLVGLVTSRLEKELGVELEIGGVDFRPVRSLVLNDVLLRDVNSDTLVYCKDLRIKADSFSWNKRSFNISEVVFDRAVFHLWVEDASNNTNIEILMDSVARRGRRTSAEREGDEAGSVQEREAESWLVGLQKIVVKNSRFTYREEIFEPLEYGVNWTDVDCRNLNVEVSGIDFAGSPMCMKVSGLSLDEKSGLKIRNMGGMVRAGASNLLITDCHFNLERSEVDLIRLEYNWVPDRHDWRYFTSRMQQCYEIGPSTVSFIDLAYFNEVLRGIDNTVKCSGVVSNTVRKLEGHDLFFELGDRSVFQGSFTSDGLPDVWNTDFHIELTEAHLSPRDLETVYLPWFDMNIPVPSPFYHLDNVDFSKITFDGTFSDFLVKARSISPELRGRFDFAFKEGRGARPDCDVMNGDFCFDRIDFGRLSGSSLLGSGAMKGVYAGIWDRKGPDFKVRSDVVNLQVGQDEIGLLDMEIDWKGKEMLWRTVAEDGLVTGGFSLDYKGDAKYSRMGLEGSLTLSDLDAFGFGIFDGKETGSARFSGFYEKEGGNSKATVRVKDLHYANMRGHFNIDSLVLEDEVEGAYNTTCFRSDVLGFLIQGNYRKINPTRFVRQLADRYLPVFADRGNAGKSQGNILNDYHFDYHIDIKDMDRILKVIYPQVGIAPGSHIRAVYNRTSGGLVVDMASDSIRYENLKLLDSRLAVKGDADGMSLDYDAARMLYGERFQLCNVSDRLLAAGNSLTNELNWCNWESSTYSGRLSAKAVFSPEGKDGYRTDIQIDPGMFVMDDSVWRIGAARLTLGSGELQVRDFSIGRGKERLWVEGRVSENPEDRLSCGLENFNLGNLARILMEEDRGIFGMANGRISMKDYYGDCLLFSDFSISDWGLMQDTLGTLDFSSYWDKERRNLILKADNRVGDGIPLAVKGIYNPLSDSVLVDVNLRQLRLERAGKYAAEYVSNTSGALSGDLSVSGSLASPALDGCLFLDSVRAEINMLNTGFSIRDSVKIRNNAVVFKDFKLEDKDGNLAFLNGYYRIPDHLYRLDARFRNFLVMNTAMTENESFYGQVYLSGMADLDNNGGLTNITVNARTEDNSTLFIPLTASQTETSSNFLHFISPDFREVKPAGVPNRYSDIRLNANLEVDDNLDVQLIFDPTVGDILQSRGRGDIKIDFDKDGSLSLFGEYRISKGEYLFTLSNLVNKKFILTPGGTINWSGSPYNAMLDVNAVYRLKTTIGELLPMEQGGDGGEDKVESGRKVPVECILNLSDNLNNPTVKFDIDFPTLETQNRSYIQSLFSSQDELNKQMFSLLVLNRFYRTDNAGDYGIQAQNVGVTTLTEMMSNQLSRWFSQFSSNVDIGIAYRVGDRDKDMGSDEIELALSTQLLNDRVTISANGNMDVGGKNAGPDERRNNIAGDFDVEVKLNRQGSLKMKAYSHTDEKVLYNSMETIQGIGVSYQESFDTFRELLRKYFGFLCKDSRKDRARRK